MKQCLKCAIQVDDDARICRRCGSILEDVGAAEAVSQLRGDSLAVPNPIDQFVAESFEWQCPGCGEQIERQFDTCWQCGTNRAGSSLPDFTHEIDDGDLDESEQDSDGGDEGAAEPAADAEAISSPQRRDCLRCGSNQIIAGVNVVSFASGELTAGRLELMALEDHERLLFMGRQARLTADVCAACGHVELRAENVRGLPQQRRKHW